MEIVAVSNSIDIVFLNITDLIFHQYIQTTF
jgi:hypothetical protein